MEERASFACPRCRAALEKIDADTLRCPADGLVFRRVDGIWRFLLPERTAIYERFMREYETVRRGEGRGSQDADYYRALPHRDLSGRMAADWRIRAAGYEALVKRVLAPLERGGALRVLDLGAGNGWLSNRLALRGHALSAVDLGVNEFDGLGAYRNYESRYTCVQAEFDRLPFPDGAADLLIYNASLHYSVDFRDTLAEGLRVLAPAGRLVILDSPVYRDGGSGAQMVRERESQFQARFGFPSNALASENYLTYARLDELAAGLKLEWRMITPFYGLRWALRPYVARVLGRREPAKFHVIVGQRAE